MIDKIKNWFVSLLERLPSTAPKAAMRYIVWYAFFLAFCAGLYIVMILADWYVTGRPDLGEMRQFLSTMLSGAAVAAIGFCARWLVDRDGDGIPDEIGKENHDARIVGKPWGKR